ncbi:MAG: NADPH-dependent FMN reductase [Gemmatimonadota bacterium]|jgi:NAD(P)H-dependent FMN reductase
MPRIVCISGTNRPNNYTSKALALVADELRNRGIEVSVLDAREFTLDFPGHPETEDAKAMQAAIRDADGVVFATPEYHGGFSAMTKLILENMGFPSALKGKPVALLGVAAGRIGAIKSLEQLRGVCSHIGALVLPGSVSIAGVQSAFDKEGNSLDAEVEESIRGIAGALLEFIKEYVCPKHTLEALVRGEDRAWSASV